MCAFTHYCFHDHFLGLLELTRDVRDHFFGLGLGLGLTVIDLGLGLGLMKY